MKRATIEALLAALIVLCGSMGVAQAQPEAATLPFVYAHHEILVSVRISGVGPYTFLLDTDTTPSAIDLRLAKRLRLPFVGAAGSGNGVGNGSSTVFPVKIPRIDVGAVQVHNLDALATDLAGLSAALGRRIDGVLGTSFLSDRVVRIDYPCRSISFLPDASLEPFTARFRVDASGINVSDDVWVGSQRVSTTFDTGDSGRSFVTGKGVATLRLEAQARAGKAVTSRGYNGTAKATTGTLDHVRIGSVSVGSMSTRFLPSSSDPFDLNIGNQTLEQFVVTFDYTRGLLTLSRPSPCMRPAP